MNHVDPPSFAERLMKSEPGNDELRRRYEEGKLALMERRLTPWHRWMGWLALPVYGLLIISGGYRLLMLLANPAEPRELVVLVAVSTVGVLALGLWIVRVLLRGGRVTWRDDQAMVWVAGLGLCAVSFALFEIARSLEDPHAARRLEFFSIVLLVGGVFGVLLERIRRSNLETRVKLVELELRVAELPQAVVSPSPDVSTSRP
jgi:hypothetical protein